MRYAFRSRWLLLCAAATCVAAPALGQSNSADLRQAAAVSADPNTPAFGLTYRSAMRGQLGANLRLWASPEREGFLLQLSPFAEFHEPASSNQALPSQYWRARVSLSAAYVTFSAVAAYRVGLALEHESDHETAHAYSRPGFLAHNALALTAMAGVRLGDFELSATPSVRLYFASCTRDRALCRNFQGDTAGGAQLDAVISAPLADIWGLVPYLSVSGFAVLGHAGVLPETHLAVHLGCAYQSRYLWLQLFALGYFGNDVGITRAQRVAQVGAGLRLSLN